MRKKDLKSGMIVELQNEERYLLVRFDNGLHGVGQISELNLDEFNDDLTCGGASKYDIVKIYLPEDVVSFNDFMDVFRCREIWSRDESREISAEEAFRVLREHYGCNVKITEE